MASNALLFDTATATATAGLFVAPTTLSSLYVSADLATPVPTALMGPADSASTQSSSGAGIAIAIAVVVIVLVLFLVTLFFFLHRRKQNRIMLQRSPSSASSQRSWVGTHYRDDSRSAMVEKNKPLPPVRSSTQPQVSQISSDWQGRPRGLSQPEKAYDGHDWF